MTLPFGEKFDLLISFEFQVILFQAPCVLNDKFFNGMSHLRQVLKRPCGPPMENDGWEHGGRGIRVGRSELSAARTAESRSVGEGTVARARDRDVYGSHVCGSRSCEVNDPPWGQFRRSLVGSGAPRGSPARREKTSLASRAERTLGASTPVHSRSRHLRRRGRSPHSKEGDENTEWPRRTSRWGSTPERFGLAAGVARGSRDPAREWEAVRRGSRQSFFSWSVRPASSTRRHGGGGSRPEAGCSRESDPERPRRRRSARCEKDDKWGKRVDPSSGADASSARARGGGGPTEPRDRDSNATGSEIIY